LKNGIHPIQPADFYDLHDMLKNWGQIDDMTATVPDLMRWYDRVVRDAVKFVHNRVVTGAIWLDCIFPGYYASMNLIRNPRRPVSEFTPYCPAALDHFFTKYDLRKIVGITWRREALFFARRFGFRIDGTLREHDRVEGEWRDFKLTSILRSEFYANTPAFEKEDCNGKGRKPAATDTAAAARVGSHDHLSAAGGSESAPAGA
jgi:hypothetical protein